MKFSYSFYLCVILVIISFSTTIAQQNLFNITSGDITNENKFFYQHQFNLYTTSFESKAHLVYGLGKGWDAGINLVGKSFSYTPRLEYNYNSNPSKGSLSPVLLGTLQKQFHLFKNFDFNISTQTGVNLANYRKDMYLNYFASGFCVYQFLKGCRFVGGVYKTNNMYVGNGNTFGVLAGYELKLSKKFYLMGDWVSGDNESSVAVIGAMYNAGKRVQLCAGWQLPNRGTIKPMGLVLEINILGWDL